MRFNLFLSQVVALATGLAFFSGASGAESTVIINESTQGYYNNHLGRILDGTPGFPAVSTESAETFPIAPDLSAASAILGNWLTEPTNLNGNWNYQSIPFSWPVYQEVAVVYEFQSDGGQGFTLDIDSDNGVFVWVDGNYLFGERGPQGPNYSFYEYQVPVGQLSAGTHYLQLLYQDYGGITGGRLNLTTAPVPEPETYAMLLAGLGIMTVMARRRRSRKS